MVRIISDSTCDLSAELLEKYGVDIIPLFINLGSEEHLDGRDITPDQIYAWADANKATPKTAACSIGNVKSCIKKHLQAGEDVVCFAISGQMSTSANSMRLAAADLEAEDRVFVIDSANLSTGVGLQVIEAAIMAQQGKTAAEIAAAAEALKPRIRASFVVDTLTYLHRGGRCSGLAALAGSTLKLHPKIVVENGAMHAEKKYRGKMSLVIEKYTEDLREALLAAKKDRVFITHSGCPQEEIDAVHSFLREMGCFKEILITRAGGVISSHCGPGTLGVLFIDGTNE